MTRFQQRRSGFTLLELLLATVIGSMILGGLYVVMNMTVKQTQASREALDAEATSRAVFNKISLDLSSVLGPAPPKSGGTPATGSTGGATTSGSAMTGGTGTDTGASSPDDTGDDTGAGSDTATQNFPFQVGVLGTSTQLTIFGSRVPSILATPGLLNQQSSSATGSDLVRVDYWKGTGGLCRQERPWVTADQTGNNFSFDLSNEASSLIADDVSDVLFEYFDGTSWVQTWEGGSGTVPTPPLAVRVTLSFSPANAGGATRTVSQTMAVRTAPGSAVPELVDPVIPTNSGTDTSEMSSSGGSGGTGGTGGTGGAGTGGTGSGGTGGVGSTGGKGGSTGGGGTTGGGSTGGGKGGTAGGGTGGRGGGAK
ncbi:MAG: prepilin-type N-terminal cleavage/methylation domain-containing protein [Gemmataceae bacterium]